MSFHEEKSCFYSEQIVISTANKSLFPPHPRTVKLEPDLGGEHASLFSSLVREARVFLGEVSQSQGLRGEERIKILNYNGTLVAQLESSI